MPGRILDLPLQPSKKNPQVRRHQRPGGDTVYENGEGNFLEPKVMDRLVEQVNRDHKGHSLEEKIAALKKMMDEYGKGDTTATGIPGQGKGKEDYVGWFDEFVESLPQKFDDFVPQSVKQEGDRLIKAGKTTGYPVESYAVSKDGEYSGFLKEGSGSVVYHQYVQFPEHGVELLRRLSKLGLEIPYEMGVLASSVLWRPEWENQAEVEIEDIDGMQIGRSLQYVIVFRPADENERKKLTDFFNRNAKAGAKDALPYSWQVPHWALSYSGTDDKARSKDQP